MSTTTFLSNETLWKTVTAIVKAASHVDAAVAYFGQGGSHLLPLKKGDRLIVNMSISTVRAGATDPREIEKLMKRGVQAFSRRNLHAKIVVADKSVISGSANVSKRADDLLDEAAIWTNDPAVLRRAKKFVGTDFVPSRSDPTTSQNVRRTTDRRGSKGDRQTDSRSSRACSTRSCGS